MSSGPQWWDVLGQSVGGCTIPTRDTGYLRDHPTDPSNSTLDLHVTGRCLGPVLPRLHLLPRFGTTVVVSGTRPRSHLVGKDFRPRVYPSSSPPSVHTGPRPEREALRCVRPRVPRRRTRHRVRTRPSERARSRPEEGWDESRRKWTEWTTGNGPRSRRRTGRTGTSTTTRERATEDGQTGNGDNRRTVSGRPGRLGTAHWGTGPSDERRPPEERMVSGTFRRLPPYPRPPWRLGRDLCPRLPRGPVRPRPQGTSVSRTADSSSSSCSLRNSTSCFSRCPSTSAPSTSPSTRTTHSWGGSHSTGVTGSYTCLCHSSTDLTPPVGAPPGPSPQSRMPPFSVSGTPHDTG